MGEHGKELLKQHIRQKRVSEGLPQVPADLFAKKPRYEMTSVEVARRNERRLKNKEAAEKSRRKKKEEFSGLQTENDQLQQDKCQLVAMIQKLKTDLNKVTKENNGLRCNIDHLKRWVGKHATDLGLGKHVQKRQAEDKLEEARATDSGSNGVLLRGNPSLRAGLVTTEEDDQQLPASTSSPLSSVSTLSSLSSVSTSSPLSSVSRASLSSISRASPLPPVTASPSAIPISKRPADSVIPAVPQAISEGSRPQLPNEEFFQPVGIRTMVSLPQLSASPDVVKPQQDVSHGATGQQEEVMDDRSQQFLYVSKDTVFIVHDENGQQIMMVNPAIQQGTKVDAPEIPQIIAATQHGQQISLEVSEVQTTSTEAPEAQGASMETSEAHEPTVEAPAVLEASVETPEIQEASVEATEIHEASVETPHTTVKAPEMQTVSGDNNDTKEAFLDNKIENCTAAEKTTTAIRDTENTPPGISAVFPSSLASSIDILLKLGCTIQLPVGAQFH